MNELVIPAALQRARIAGRAWAAVPLSGRLGVIARAPAPDRAAGRRALAATVARSPAETLVAEVLPLAEAARFLLRQAPRLLAPVRPRGGRPLWLFGVRAEIRREACGVVLILARRAITRCSCRAHRCCRRWRPAMRSA